MAESGTQTANERFDALWEEVGAKRLILGDEEKGVEIRVDADLSVFAILEKLKQASESGHATGDITSDEKRLVDEMFDETVGKLSGGLHEKLRRQFEKLSGR